MQEKRFDYLIVGAGLFGATFAHLMKIHNKKCLVIEERPHIGGLCHTEKQDGIWVHKYGPHIFHTKDKAIWNFVNNLVEFNNYTHKVKVNYNKSIYSFPVNLQTFYELLGISDPDDAMENYKSMAVRQDIDNIFLKNYSEKMWGMPLKKIPKEIIKRLPVRFKFNDSYYDDNEYQGIPVDGYTNLISTLLKDTEIKIGINFSSDRKYWKSIAKKIIYTGRIDELLDYELGELPFRKLYFNTYTMKGIKDYQGIAQMNYTDNSGWTRVIEHKHFTYNYNTPDTVITFEYPEESGAKIMCGEGIISYPIETEENKTLYNEYKEMLKVTCPEFIAGGRLGIYQYLNMDQVIRSAMDCTDKELKCE